MRQRTFVEQPAAVTPGRFEATGRRRDEWSPSSALRLALCAAILATAAVLLIPASYAQGDPGLAACATIADEEERLACYDRLARPDAAAPPAPAGGGESEPAANRDSSKSNSGRAPASPSPTAEPAGSGRPDVPAPPSRPERPAELPRASYPETAPEEPVSPAEDFSATVVEVFQQPRGEHTVVLDNGQVWQENFASRYFPVEPGDEVRIRKRFFSGYRLITPSGKGFNVGQVR